MRRRNQPIRVRKPPASKAMGKAVSYPGIDPRNWVWNAVTTSASRASADGYVVDVELMPDGGEETARVGSIYGGSGYGLFFPLEPDVEGIVLAPGGDFANCVFMPRVWSQPEPVPAAMYGDPANESQILLHVKEGHSVRVVTSGAGGVTVVAGTGGVTVEAEGDVTVNTQGNVDVTAAGSAIIDSNDIQLTRGGASPVPLADHLDTWLTTSLTVSTAMGPSGPSTVPLTANVKSTKVKAS